MIFCALVLIEFSRFNGYFLCGKSELFTFSLTQYLSHLVVFSNCDIEIRETLLASGIEGQSESSLKGQYASGIKGQ